MFKYRLQPLLDQKIALKHQAEEALGMRQRELQAEKQKLEEASQRQRELTQKKDQLRQQLLSPPPQQLLKGDEIRRRLDYLRGVGADADAAKDAVFAQRLAVEESQERVGEARHHLAECSRAVEILEKHREKLSKRFQQQVERTEAMEHDEIGNMLHLRRQS